MCYLKIDNNVSEILLISTCNEVNGIIFFLEYTIYISCRPILEKLCVFSSNFIRCFFTGLRNLILSLCIIIVAIIQVEYGLHKFYIIAYILVNSHSFGLVLQMVFYCNTVVLTKIPND